MSPDSMSVAIRLILGLCLPLSVARAENARWRWRKTHGVGPTDLTRKGGDDRVLAVYFAFADPEHAKAGTEIEVETRGKRTPAVVSKMPFVTCHYHRPA